MVQSCSSGKVVVQKPCRTDKLWMENSSSPAQSLVPLSVIFKKTRADHGLAKSLSTPSAICVYTEHITFSLQYDESYYSHPWIVLFYASYVFNGHLLGVVILFHRLSFLKLTEWNHILILVIFIYRLLTWHILLSYVLFRIIWGTQKYHQLGMGMVLYIF